MSKGTKILRINQNVSSLAAKHFLKPYLSALSDEDVRVITNAVYHLCEYLTISYIKNKDFGGHLSALGAKKEK